MDYWPPFYNPKARSSKKFLEKTRDSVNWWWETWVLPIFIFCVIMIIVDQFFFPIEGILK